MRSLVQAGIAAEAIHGNKSQGQRERVLAAFRDGRLRTLVATDIAARGIDVDGVSHVFNYDLPNVAESYVHRIGRTARAGTSGIAISFCDREEVAFLRAIEKLIRQQIPIEGEVASARAPSERPRPAKARDDRPSKGRGNHPPKGRGDQRQGRRPRAERPRRDDGYVAHRDHPTSHDDIGGVAFMKSPRRERVAQPR